MHNKVIVVDRVGEVTYFADFDHTEATALAPLDRLQGCRWTISRSSATEFEAASDATRALSSRNLLGKDGVSIVEASSFPATLPGSRLGYPFSRVHRTSRKRLD